MSEDARNSIHLWVSVIAYVLLAWAALHFGWFEGVPIEWTQGGLLVVLAVNLCAYFWRRRASAKAKNNG